MTGQTRNIRFLRRMTRACNGYQRAIESFVQEQSANPQAWRNLLRNTRFQMSRLYLGYTESALLSAIKRKSNSRSTTYAQVDVVAIESSCRDTLGGVLNSYFPWDAFDLHDAFVELTGLTTREDYTAQLALHLPEIYGESFRLSAITSALLNRSSDPSLSELLVGLQHAGRNHITFVQPAMDALCEESNWLT